jgi:hypothetical protein
VIYWHHASEPTEDVRFFSRHFRMFDDADKAQQEQARGVSARHGALVRQAGCHPRARSRT